MAESLAQGRYTVTWRERQWVVRTPEGRTLERFGTDDDSHAKASVRAERLNQKLRGLEQR